MQRQKGTTEVSEKIPSASDCGLIGVFGIDRLLKAEKMET